MIVAAVTTAFWLAVWRPWQLPRFKHIFTCLFSYATCVVVKNSAAPVFAWVRWHGQSRAPARRQRRRVANWQQRCVRAAAASLDCGSLHGMIAACFAYACSAFCAGAEKKSHKAQKRHVEHRHSPTPRPRHCHARTRCPAPCTRAHACRARSSRTHHACAPRQPCTRTTRQHALKSLAAVLESLATGCPSAGSPLAHLARMRSTNTLATSAARPHASPTCCACH